MAHWLFFYKKIAVPSKLKVILKQLPNCLLQPSDYDYSGPTKMPKLPGLYGASWQDQVMACNKADFD